MSPNSLKKSILISLSISFFCAKLFVNISLSKSIKLEYILSFKVYRLFPHEFPIFLIEPIPL